MSDLDYTFAHRLNAVLGWLELDNPAEARAELKSLPPQLSERPEVLDLHWLLDARQSNWEDALKVANRILQLEPDRPIGWLHRAYALRRVPEGGLVKAAEALRPAFDKFPEDATIPYNLACYACQLGKLEEARNWLAQALKRGQKRKLKTMALADTDLEDLWPEIRKW